MFKKATKTDAKLRMAICGPSGSGKTYTSLTLAGIFGKIAVIDTERGSASKYADKFGFDVLELQPPFHPNRFCDAIKEASDYDVLIIDSLSHAWAGEGGLLEEVDKIAARNPRANSFTAWKKGSPIQQKLVDTILNAPMHIIATMRAKQEYILEEQEKGGRKSMAPRKVGLAPVQRNDIEFEFDVVGNMDLENTLIIDKSRCPAVSGGVYVKPDDTLAGTLKEWLSEPEKKVVQKKKAVPKKPKKTDELEPAVEKVRETFDNEAFTDRVSRAIDFFSDGCSLQDLEAFIGKPHKAWVAEDFDKLTEIAREINAYPEEERGKAIRVRLTLPDREPGIEG